MRKRKLMLISPMLHQGGFERVCVTTARLLQPYFDVTIVIFDSANIAYDVEGLSIIDIQMGVRKGKLQKILNIIRRSRKVRKLKKEMQPEIAYSFGPTANMVNAFSKTGKEKVWLGLRNYTDVEEETKMRLLVKKADLIVCCSRDIEKSVKIKYKFNNTAVLYNLYDADTIRKEAAASDPPLPFSEELKEVGSLQQEPGQLRYLVSMGRDDPMKGFWHMIKAFKLVHDQIPEARLILMGAGTFQKYKTLAEQLKITDAIYFAGMRRDPYALLKYGEVYLLTSANEGFPNALVEAMTLSLAPVSTNCLTGPAEILVRNGDTASLNDQFTEKQKEKETPVIYGDYGIVVPEMQKEENLDPADITEEERNLADTVIRLLQDEKLLQSYRQTAARRAGDFTYEKYLEQFLKLAEE
ncbi:glycosyltransferase [Suilimivivens sp.]|uniref:glycosyltransferase n=1 Tax=Suilimivivens sp. TaxID=2981669 RepID=UPI003078131E